MSCTWSTTTLPLYDELDFVDTLWWPIRPSVRKLMNNFRDNIMKRPVSVRQTIHPYVRTCVRYYLSKTSSPKEPDKLNQILYEASGQWGLVRVCSQSETAPYQFSKFEHLKFFRIRCQARYGYWQAIASYSLTSVSSSALPILFLPHENFKFHPLDHMNYWTISLILIPCAWSPKHGREVQWCLVRFSLRSIFTESAFRSTSAIWKSLAGFIRAGRAFKPPGFATS